MTTRGNQVLTKVSDLINHVTGEWDEELIRDNFWHIDAERILQIPIYHHETEDFVAWHLTKNGIFSVRSAYYKQWEDCYGDNAGPAATSPSTIHPVWKKLWSLKVPSKIKIFLWHRLNNAIPCQCVLANRHIGTSSQCPVCRVHAEDISHAIFKCPRAGEIWRVLGLQEMIIAASSEGRSGAEIIEQVLCDPCHQITFLNVINVPEMFAITSWYIWWQCRLIKREEVV